MTTPTLPAYVVEGNFGTFFGEPIWYDLTPYVELQEGMSITRGRADQQSDPQPGQWQAVFNDSDGRFTPGLASSPYSPYVLDGAPIRVTCRRPAGINLLDNGSFELGVDDWVNGGVGTAPTHAQSTTHIYTDGGQWALGVTWAVTAAEADVQRRIPGLTVGATYTLSYYVYVPTGSPNVYLKAVTESGATTTTGAASVTHDAYTRISVTFVAGSTTHLIQIANAAAASGGSCWVDGGQLELGGSATALDPRWCVASPRYYGFTAEAPMRWVNPAATYAQASWSATDLMERVGSRAGSLRPFDVEEALLDAPLVLFPLDEQDGATVAGNLGSAQSSGTLLQDGSGATYQFAAATGPPADGTASLQLTRGAGIAGWYITAPLGLAAASWSVEAWVDFSVTDLTILHLGNTSTGSTSRPAATLTNVGANLDFFVDDVVASGSGIGVVAASIADGATHHVVGTCSRSGGTTRLRLYVDGAQVGTSSGSTLVATTAAAYLLIGGAKGYVKLSGAVNHVAVYTTVLSAERVSVHYHAGWDGFGGETSDQRISRIAAYARLDSLTAGNVTGVWVLDDAALSILDSTTILASSDLGLENGAATVYGQSGGGSDYLTEIRSVTTSEGGLAFVDAAGQFRFHNRSHRYNQPATAVVPAEYVNADLYPAYDLQGVVNDATVTTDDGVTARAVDTTSRDQRGTYSGGFTSLTRDVLDAWSAATWIIDRHGTPAQQYRQVPFDLMTLPADTVTTLLSLDVGDRLDITGLPSQAAAATASLVVEGYSEQVTEDTWTLTFNTSPAAGYAVWQLDSPTASVLDSTTVPAW